MCLHFMAVYPATSVAEMAVLESSFTEYVSDGVAAWSAMRSMEEWPAEVQAEVNLATGDSSGGATCAPGSVLACSFVLMPGLTLEWVVDGAKMVGRLNLETAGAWLAVGLAGSGGDLMTGGWAVVGEFGDGGGARAYDLTGMSRSLLVEDTSGARLLSANVTEVDGAGQLWFEVAMNDDSGRDGDGDRRRRRRGWPTTSRRRRRERRARRRARGDESRAEAERRPGVQPVLRVRGGCDRRATYRGSGVRSGTKWEELHH